MPVFKYICPVCQQPDSRLLTPAGSRVPQRCRKTSGCQGVLTRDIQAPGMVHKEVIDNGIQVRRAERDIDIQRLVEERAHKDYRNRE